MPTSGAGPYVLDALITNREMIDGVNYGLRVVRGPSEESCAVEATGSSLAPIIDAFLAGNAYSDSLTVAPDRCRAYTVTLTDLNTNDVLGTITQHVDNI